MAMAMAAGRLAAVAGRVVEAGAAVQSRAALEGTRGEVEVAGTAGVVVVAKGRAAASGAEWAVAAVAEGGS